MNGTSWSYNHRMMLGGLRPSLELVTGKVEFPPSLEIVEAFVDRTSMYGFHGTDVMLFEQIWREGLRTNLEIGAVYFIADRGISADDINYSVRTNRLSDLRKIPGPEYLDRLAHSLAKSIMDAMCQHPSSIAHGIVVIDRNLALPNERRDAVEAGELREWRGEGYPNDPTEKIFGPYLDEGATTRRNQAIPAAAIVGGFIPTRRKGSFLFEDTDDQCALVEKFYRLVAEDFQKKCRS